MPTLVSEDVPDFILTPFKLALFDKAPVCTVQELQEIDFSLFNQISSDVEYILGEVDNIRSNITGRFYATDTVCCVAANCSDCAESATRPKPTAPAV
jgi:hypothetical protein